MRVKFQKFHFKVLICLQVLKLRLELFSGYQVERGQAVLLQHLIFIASFYTSLKNLCCKLRYWCMAF